MGTGYTARSQNLSNAPGTSSPGWIGLRMHGKGRSTFYEGSQFLSAALTHTCPRPTPTVASPGTEVVVGLPLCAFARDDAPSELVMD